MQDINDLRNIIKQQRIEGNYDGMVKSSEDMWNQHFEQINDFDCWNYSYALNKLQKYKKSIEICRTGYEINSNNKFLNSSYAWAGYMHYLNNNNGEDIDDVEKKAEAILTILENVPDNTFTFNKTILKVMTLSANNNEWHKVLKWVKKLSANQLSSKDILIKGKKVPSEKLSYYYKYTKALEKTENYADCLDVCKDALYEFSHDFWLRWRKAICLMHSDEIEDSIAILEELLLEKSDWFLLNAIAEAYYKIENFNKGLEFAIKSCLEASKSPNVGMTADAFLTTAQILHKLQDNNNAKKHVELTYLLRIEQGWTKIPAKLAQVAKNLNISLENIDGKSSKLIEELKKYWNDKLNDFVKNLPVYRGKIKTILPKGGGFIKGEDGADIFFSKGDFHGNPNNLIIDMSVQYNVKDSYDKKKKKKSKSAYNIKNIN